MRLRTFTGRTTSEAMAQVRAYLGDEAVIVSTQDDGSGGARVTAALDQADLPPEVAAEFAIIDAVEDALSFHGLPSALHQRILAACRPFAVEDALVAMASGLAALYRCTPFTAD